jgi:hypothetical protein
MLPKYDIEFFLLIFRLWWTDVARVLLPDDGAPIIETR